MSIVNPSSFTDFDEAVFLSSISTEWLAVVLLKIMNWDFPGLPSFGCL